MLQKLFLSVAEEKVDEDSNEDDVKTDWSRRCVILNSFRLL